MDSVTNLSDGELLLQMAAGNEEAFALLYRRLSPSVYRFALQMSGNTAMAEEVTQDTFVVLIRHRDRYEERQGPLLPWLLGVARNLARQRIGTMQEPQDAAELASIPDLPAGGDVLEDITRRETVDAVRNAVLSLPPAYREVVALCELQEMDYHAAARVLSCPVGTVRSDRKSTRLNSSHSSISYAVFCLKKK